MKKKKEQAGIDTGEGSQSSDEALKNTKRIKPRIC